MEKKVFDIFNFKKKTFESTVIDNPDTIHSIIPTPQPVCTVSVNNDTVVLDLGDLNSGPIRPVLKAYPKTQFGKQKRSFSSVYYNDYDWHEYSIKKDAIFCYACRNFANESGHFEQTFSSLGFSNWKKLSGFKDSKTKHTRLEAHNTCIHHKTAMIKWSSFRSTKTTGSILNQLDSAHKKQVLENRNYIKQLIEITLYLSRQGISFRGHREDENSLNQGNFKEACKLAEKLNDNFARHFKLKTNYTSWSVQNAILSLCASNINTTICDEIKKCGFFSIMVDEARSFKEEQLSLCIRYTNKFEVVERFLTFINVSQKQDANSLSTFIFNFLDINRLSEIPIVAQSYDGASVMAGRFGGVQQKIKMKFPFAIFTHCMAHRVNLVVLDMCKMIKETRMIFNCIESIYVYFSQPTNNFKLLEIQKKLEIKNVSITRISDTRWNCRERNISSVRHNFQALINVLNEEIENSLDRDTSQAIGIISIMNTVSFIFHIIVLEDILKIINILSIQLQQKSATLGQAVSVINGVIKTIKDKRSSRAFSEVWSNVKLFADIHDIKICSNIKRKRKEPIKLQNFHLSTTTGAEHVQADQFEDNVENHWRVVYFKVIDSLVTNMEKRFSTESLDMAIAVDNFFKLNYNESIRFIDHYKELLNIDLEALKCEMKVAKNCVINSKQKIEVDVDDLKQVVECNIYPNLFNLLRLALTLPISSASCERSFSAMRRIRNWLRTSCSQDRFTDLSIIHIERSLSNKILANDILKEFVKTDHKLQL